MRLGRRSGQLLQAPEDDELGEGKRDHRSAYSKNEAYIKDEDGTLLRDVVRIGERWVRGFVCSLGLRVVHCLAQCSSTVLFDTFIKGHVRESEKKEREKESERERDGKASASKSSA